MLYLDASLLTAMVSREARSDQARQWLVQQAGENLMTSYWGLTEVASALSIKQRTGAMTDPDRKRADRLLHQLVEQRLTLAAVTTADFVAAARLCTAPLPQLRASDALHLSIAARHGAALHTLDEAQAEAGRAHGIEAVVSVERFR
jgi:uncharacterized protein